MAKTNKNDITYGNTGKFGKRISFRSFGDETLMVSRPGKRTTALSEDQKSVKEIFQRAVRYAKRVGANPELKAMYKAKTTRKNSYHALAVRDFIKVPVVEGIEVSNYKGEPGDIITIIAYDDFRIAKLYVQIFDHLQNLVEEGWATATNSNEEWEYTATSNLVLTSGYAVLATAYDLPGNRGSLEIEIPG